MDNSKQLYISPSFFEQLIPNIKFNNVSEDLYSKVDLYTEVKQHTSQKITSKFKEIRYIPLSNSVIDYESDIWSFEEYTLINNSHARLHFENMDNYYKDLLKDFILLIILKGNLKYSTLYGYFEKIRFFFKYLYKQNLYNIEHITSSHVESFFNTIKSKSTRTYIKYQTDIKNFFILYDSENKTHLYTNEIAGLCKRMEFRQLKAEIKNNHRTPIPEQYFDQLIKVLITVMNDIHESKNKRAQAAILLIDTQTGLRASELSLLEANSVEDIVIDDKSYRMIHYKIIKTAKGNTGYKKEITFINDISYKAYSVLMELYEENRKELNTNLLYCPKYTKLPADSSKYIYYLKYFCVKYYDKIDSINEKYKESLHPVSLKSYIKTRFKHKSIEEYISLYFPDLNEDSIIYVPFVHQFRNTVVDHLLRKGVQLEFIRRYMGHLSEETTAGYAGYNDSDLQENREYSENVLRTYLNGEARILGNSGNRLMTRINEWLEENNLNVSTDLDEIVDKLLKLVPIRSKSGGMCIKGSKLTYACSVDAKTDEFFCACGVCPNICHFYFMIDVSYSDFKACLEIYEYNLNNGFKRQAEKEKSKLTYLITTRLIPELDELEKEIEKLGMDTIIKKHPYLKNIIYNMDNIREEVLQWK